MHARAYYTAEALGKLGEIERPFFDEVHMKGNLLDTEEKLTTFFAAHGVDAWFAIIEELAAREHAAASGTASAQ